MWTRLISGSFPGARAAPLLRVCASLEENSTDL
jgi:hypothetical protein